MQYRPQEHNYPPQPQPGQYPIQPQNDPWRSGQPQFPQQPQYQQPYMDPRQPDNRAYPQYPPTTGFGRPANPNGPLQPPAKGVDRVKRKRATSVPQRRAPEPYIRPDVPTNMAYHVEHPTEQLAAPDMYIIEPGITLRNISEGGEIVQKYKGETAMSDLATVDKTKDVEAAGMDIPAPTHNLVGDEIFSYLKMNASINKANAFSVMPVTYCFYNNPDKGVIDKRAPVSVEDIVDIYRDRVDMNDSLAVFVNTLMTTVMNVFLDDYGKAGFNIDSLVHDYYDLSELANKEFTPEVTAIYTSTCATLVKLCNSFTITEDEETSGIIRLTMPETYMVLCDDVIAYTNISEGLERETFRISSTSSPALYSSMCDAVTVSEFSATTYLLTDKYRYRVYCANDGGDIIISRK
jgi:hypothetical protein